MKNENNSIVFFTKYTYAGASSRYRVFQFIPYFELNGFQVFVDPLFTDDYLKARYNNEGSSLLFLIKLYLKRIRSVLKVSKKSLVYIEYELLPYFPSWLERWIKWKGIKYVVGYDDAVYHNYDWKGNFIVRLLLSYKIPDVVKGAAHVITGSEYLTNFALQYNTSVTEIPTTINFEKYESVPAHTKVSSHFTIGWIGTPSSGNNLIKILPAIQQFLQQYPSKLILIGFDRTLAHLFKGLNIEIEDWKEETEISRMKSFDVGIMPLNDTPFNQGKCGFKLIQYMACGLPTIFSPLRSNVNINKNNHNLSATSIEEWIVAFETIYQDQVYYKTVVGAENKKIVRNYYSTRVNQEPFINLFKGLRSS